MKTSTFAAAALLFGTLSVSACTTTSDTSADTLRAGELHFPTRRVNNLDDAMLTTMRGDLVEMDNCLYLTNVRNQPSGRRYVVTWPSNSRIERRELSGSRTQLEVVSAGAEFNDNTRSAATIPSRIEFLGMLKNERFEHGPRFNVQRNQGCQGDRYAPIRTWRTVGTVRG